jgi:hypothetical protein
MIHKSPIHILPSIWIQPHRRPHHHLASIRILRSRSISKTLSHTCLLNVAPGYESANNLSTPYPINIHLKNPRRRATHLPILIQFLRSASPTSIFFLSVPRPSPSFRSLINSAWMKSATSEGMTKSPEAARVCTRNLTMPCVSCSAEAVDGGSSPKSGICRSTCKPRTTDQHESATATLECTDRQKTLPLPNNHKPQIRLHPKILTDVRKLIP